MPDGSSKRPPAAVLTVAAVLCLAAAVSFLTGSSLLFPGLAWHRIWELNRPAYVAFAHLGRVAGVLLLLLGVLSAITGAGLFRGKRWAWWMAIALFGINGLGDVVTLILERDVGRSGSGVLIALLFLWCLMSAGARRYFAAEGTGT
jgi:hypothetical protein